MVSAGLPVTGSVFAQQSESMMLDSKCTVLGKELAVEGAVLDGFEEVGGAYFF